MAKAAGLSTLGGVRLSALSRCCLLIACLCGLVGCAAKALAPPSSGIALAVVQVMVRTAPAAASFDAERLVREASRVAGVPVHYGAAAGARWHSLVLNCSDEAACTEAIQRLSGETALFDAVERDAPRRINF